MFVLIEYGQQDKDDNTTFAALELLTGLVGEMVGVNLEGLVKESNIIQLLIQNMKNSLSKVRQASFNLFFELIESCFDNIIRPFLRKLTFNMLPYR